MDEYTKIFFKTDNLKRNMNMKELTILLVTGAMVAGSVHAELLFEEAFDYGPTTDDIENVSNWVTGSNVVKYDHDGGLTHAGIGGETGGSLWHDFASDQRGGDSPDAAFNPFTGAASGTEYWLSGLIQINNLGETTVIGFGNTETVNFWGFGVDAEGDVFLQGSDNGGAANTTGAYHDTGIDIVADGSTYLFLSRATKGTGTSPTNSTIDFWFNHSDTSSVGALGGATFTTGADSKIGRESGAYNVVFAQLAFGNRVDEIRFGDSLTDVVAIPEPSTFALLGIALGSLLLFRRKF
jgi:hypothetical protein